MSTPEKGFGVIVVPIERLSNGERIWSIAPLSENNGKRELVVGYQEELQGFADKREYPAGAAEVRDGVPSQKTVLLTAARETAEETGIIPNISDLQIYDISLSVLQERNNKEVDFDVAVVLWAVTAEQLFWLKNYCGGEVVDHNEPGFLSLRPRDRIVTGLIYDRSFDILTDGYSVLFNIDAN